MLVGAFALALIAAGWIGWRAWTPRAPAASVTTVEDKLATAPRLPIVVLPFENLSGDKEQEYFADGITDDLTTDLSHLSDSFVIARNTAFTYKGKALDAKQIGREAWAGFSSGVYRVGSYKGREEPMRALITGAARGIGRAVANRCGTKSLPST